jgi:hypothetical protein
MLAASIAVALAFWGPAPPPCTVESVRVVDFAGGEWGVAWVGGPTCPIEIQTRRWKWWELCATVVHEYGHVYGRGHSSDPDDVMAPFLSDPAPMCRGKRPADIQRGSRHLLEQTHPAREIPA